MSSQWHKLRLPQKELPPLLFQYTCTRKGYDLYVTDLASIWSERLSREQIVRRAEETATTIDPSEGPEQLDVLLSKIGDALRADGGSATLSRGAADSLELTTSTKLPAPLKPLRWSLFLAKEPPGSLTAQLLLPLLKDEARWETDQRFLLDQIKQKDWVLGKLFDKLEAIGVDLGTVFPAAAGLRATRKSSSRSEAAKFVKGIAPFDEQSWLAKTGKSSAGDLGIAANIAHATSESDGKLNLAELNPPRDQWWNDLATHPEPSLAQEESEDTAKDLRQASKDQATAHSDLDLDKEGDSTAESEDEEFQRQETPPRFKTRDKTPAVTPPISKTKEKSPSPPLPAEETDQTTASEPESEPAPAPRQRRTPSIPPEPKQPAPRIPPREPPPKKPKGGLGVIGGKKKKEEEQPQRTRTPSPTSAPKAPKPTTEPEQPVQPSPKTKRPSKLGTIGGKSKAKAPAHTETAPSTQEPATPSPKGARPPSTPEAAAAAGITEPSPKKTEPAAELPSASEAAPETEKEKADRRREELKRQLEAKSNAPKKKKRRF